MQLVLVSRADNTGMHGLFMLHRESGGGAGSLGVCRKSDRSNGEVHKRSLRSPLKMAAARDVVDKELKRYFSQQKSGSVQCRDSCQVWAKPGRASPDSAFRMCTWKIRLARLSTLEPL